MSSSYGFAMVLQQAVGLAPYCAMRSGVFLLSSACRETGIPTIACDSGIDNLLLF